MAVDCDGEALGCQAADVDADVVEEESQLG